MLVELVLIIDTIDEVSLTLAHETRDEAWQVAVSDALSSVSLVRRRRRRGRRCLVLLAALEALDWRADHRLDFQQRLSHVAHVHDVLQDTSNNHSFS